MTCINSTGLVFFKDKVGEWRMVMLILNPIYSSNRCLVGCKQICKITTPGGRKDSSDKSLFSTFSREYKEETGIKLPRLFSNNGIIPRYDYNNHTRIYFSHIEDNSKKIRFDLGNVKPDNNGYPETVGIIFPKVQHIKDMLERTHSDEKVIITTGCYQYYLRHCVRKSLERMFDLGLLELYK
jgi:8-oxo-dGTP pyrophosphatase MutT (NUDIX family)